MIKLAFKILREGIAIAIFWIGWIIVIISGFVGGKEFAQNLIDSMQLPVK